MSSEHLDPHLQHARRPDANVPLPADGFACTVAVVTGGASGIGQAAAEDATPSDWGHEPGRQRQGHGDDGFRHRAALRAAGGGAIVNIASISPYIAQPNRWTCNTTKGAVLASIRCQALDLARAGIRVNSVSPGTIWTPELDRMTGGDRAAWEPVFGEQHMLGRVGEPSRWPAPPLLVRRWRQLHHRRGPPSRRRVHRDGPRPA